MHRVLVTLALMLTATAVRADSRAEFFESKIRPLLIDRCESCHDREAKGSLRLDSRRGFLRGGRSGALFVAGKPEKSLLFQVVSGRHAKLKMPPDDPLEAHEVAAIEQWIRDGAVWPASATTAIDRDYGITDWRSRWIP